MNRLYLVLPFVFLYSLAFAQFEKQLFFTFDTKDVDQIVIDVVDDYETKTWEGDHVLVQENIQLFDATLNIFRYFIGEGRYDIVRQGEGGNLTLTSKDNKYYSIMTKKGACYEVVKLIILIPENFEGTGNSFLKKNEEN